MVESYRRITSELAERVRLVMTDVDGTLLSSGEYIAREVADAISGLQQQDIIVGLVSGRTIPRLENLASFAGINGPIVAENGSYHKHMTPAKLRKLIETLSRQKTEDAHHAQA